MKKKCKEWAGLVKSFYYAIVVALILSPYLLIIIFKLIQNG